MKDSHGQIKTNNYLYRQISLTTDGINQSLAEVKAIFCGANRNIQPFFKLFSCGAIAAKVN